MRAYSTIVTVVLLCNSVAIACPSCGEAVAAQSAVGPNLSGGFAASIALMLAMPLALVGLGVWAACNIQIRPTKFRDDLDAGE